MNEKMIILTGGAGFIGSCFLRYLNDLGMKNLVIVDELGDAEKWKNLVGKKFLEFVAKDKLFDWLTGKENGISSFIHLGACSSTTEMDADYLLENNTHYSIQLAQYALTYGHRFIYASSAATYGDGSLGFSDDHTLLEQYRPLNMYGFSKHLFDLWLQDNNLLDKVVGLKYFNIFGPNEFHKGKMASAVSKMVPDAIEKKNIFLFKSTDPQYPDGEQMRDFLYVKDVVRMTASFLTNDRMGIYNIGMGTPHTWNQLAKAVIKTLDPTVKIEYIDMPTELVGKYQNYTAADMKKFFSAVPDFQFQFTFEDAVSDYIQNHLIAQKLW